MADDVRSVVTAVMASRGGGEHGAQRRYRLSVVGGPSPPVSLAVGSEALTLGTAPSSGLVLADPTVSRHHARIELGEGGLLLRDLGSTNGTFIDGVRIELAHLGERALLRLGGSEVRFELTAEVERFELHPQPQLGRLSGRSVAMRRLFAVVGRVAASESTVLIHGESGTGKELIAEAVHEGSRRAGGPFVVVDCAALPPSLIESELFGHERGAFTGAVQARAGAFELADGGTLFLDEVGELDVVLQPRLLRALESRRVKRLGAGDYRNVDVRVVAATHRDLEKMVSTGDFREDLYHRLAVITVRVPTLRDRPEDIDLLVDGFADEICARDPRADRSVLTAGLRDGLRARRWPGNVRELRNTVERLLVIGAIDAGAAAPPEAAATGSDVQALPWAEARRETLERFERDYVTGLLERAGGNVAEAARLGSMERTYLFKLIRKHRLRDH